MSKCRRTSLRPIALAPASSFIIPKSRGCSACRKFSLHNRRGGLYDDANSIFAIGGSVTLIEPASAPVLVVAAPVRFPVASRLNDFSPLSAGSVTVTVVVGRGRIADNVGSVPGLFDVGKDPARSARSFRRPP